MNDPIIYVSIGNSDDKLTQQQWNMFCSELRSSIGYYSKGIVGVWWSSPDSMYQNMCIAFRPKRGGNWTENLKRILETMANNYDQDSIAWAEVANTEFLGGKNDG